MGCLVTEIARFCPRSFPPKNSCIITGTPIKSSKVFPSWHRPPFLSNLADNTVTPVTAHQRRSHLRPSPKSSNFGPVGTLLLVDHHDLPPAPTSIKFITSASTLGATPALCQSRPNLRRISSLEIPPSARRRARDRSIKSMNLGLLESEIVSQSTFSFITNAAIGSPCRVIITGSCMRLEVYYASAIGSPPHSSLGSSS